MHGPENPEDMREYGKLPLLLVVADLDTCLPRANS